MTCASPPAPTAANTNDQLETDIMLNEATATDTAEDTATIINEASDAGILDVGMEAADVRAVLTDIHTLSADVTGFLLDTVKNTPKPWQQMTYAEQQELIDRLTIRSGSLVRGIVRTIAAAGRQVIMAQVKTVANKDKAIEATLTMRKDSEHRHALFDSQGMDVLIVVADASDCFQGDQPVPEAPRDGQEELPLGDDDDRPVFDSTDAGRE